MIPQFALRLIVGLSLLWALLPRPLITSGFFRIQALVTLGLSVLTALTIDQWPDVAEGRTLAGAGLARVGMIAAAVVSFATSALWTLERRQGGARGGLLILAVGGGLLTASAVQVDADGRFFALRLVNALRVVDAWTSAAQIGALTGGMLLGHWYLTATGMSLQPLSRATRIAQAAVLLRLALAATATLLAEPEMRSRLTETHAVWMLLRWGAGLAGPLIVAFLTPGTLRYRNTQSATGVLFAGVILTFIGESAALLLSRELRCPL